MTKIAMKRILCGLLAFIILLTVLPGLAFASPDEETSAPCCYDCLREGYSIEEIREIVNARGQVYQDFRVQSDTTGTMTYSVPVSDGEIEYLMNIYYGNVQPLSTDHFTETRIRYSGLAAADSIVIMLLGDGFTRDEYGTWPNPNQGTVLYHADNAINAMLDTRPFELFSHLFTVYVIHSYGSNPNTGLNGYLGTIAAPGCTPQFGNPGTAIGGELTGVSSNVRQYRIRQLADNRVDRSYQTMVQVISNATGGTGFAWMGWHYLINVTIGVTSIRNAANPPGGHNAVWPNGAAWHGTFIHEFGHSFGNLVDEHGDFTERPTSWVEQRANTTESADAELKWRHWAGHRNVLESPMRFFNGWAIPGIVRAEAGQSGCMMRASWGNRNFCGVCTAELVRRMAIIAEEPFHGRSPVTTLANIPNNSPNYPRYLNPHIDLNEREHEVTRILDSAFHGNRALETVTIPASIETIGDFAFIGTENLEIIHNQRVVPQQINYTTFAGVTRANVTVYIPLGTTQAYRDAGWWGFNLVETVPDYLYAKFEFYTSASAENEYIRTPVEVGQPLDMTSVESALDELDKEARFAFWGWFTEDALNASGRRSTASNVVPNLRRPVVGTEGFDVEQVITQEVLDRYANSDGVIHLRSVWSLWGDVNDDGMVNPIDASLLMQHVSGMNPAPILNRAPADVHRDGVVNPTDASILMQYVSGMNPRPVLGLRPQPTARAFTESSAQWRISYDAASETVPVRIELYQNSEHGMGLTLLTLQYDSSQLSNPRVVPVLRLDRDRFDFLLQATYDMLVVRGYTEADMVLMPIFAGVLLNAGAYHNGFTFDYVLYPNHIHGPDVVMLRWSNQGMRIPYMGSDIFVYVTFDVAPGAQLSDRGAVQFTDGLQFMGWATGAGENQLVLVD